MKKYSILHPAVFKLDGGAMFGIIPKPLWSKKIPADDLNRIQLSLRVMLIETKKRKILIDTGIGDYHGKKFDERFGVLGTENPLIKSLREQLNLQPESITDLIVSHLHFDHVGGLGGGETHHCLFPKAKIHLHEKHYDYALNPTIRDAGSFHQEYFRPMIEDKNQQGLVHWLSGEEGIVIEDDGDLINFKCSHGHTPFLVHPYDEKFIYMADLVPTAAHVPLPWVMGYDISPGITTKDKKRFFDFIIEKNLTMIFEHDMEYWGSSVIKRSEVDYLSQSELKVSDLNGPQIFQ